MGNPYQSLHRENKWVGLPFPVLIERNYKRSIRVFFKQSKMCRLATPNLYGKGSPPIYVFMERMKMGGGSPCYLPYRKKWKGAAPFLFFIERVGRSRPRVASLQKEWARPAHLSTSCIERKGRPDHPSNVEAFYFLKVKSRDGQPMHLY